VCVLLGVGVGRLKVGLFVGFFSNVLQVQNFLVAWERPLWSTFNSLGKDFL
jgi:hypothetical protein